MAVVVVLPFDELHLFSSTHRHTVVNYSRARFGEADFDDGKFHGCWNDVDGGSAAEEGVWEVKTVLVEDESQLNFKLVAVSVTQRLSHSAEANYN